jgi:hypothetical protein
MALISLWKRIAFQLLKTLYFVLRGFVKKKVED